MTDTPFTVPESQLVARLGVARSLIRSARQNGMAGQTWTRDVDWMGDGKGVFWSEKAAAALAMAVGAPLPENGERTPDVVEILTVTSQPLRRQAGRGGVVVLSHFPNPRVIRARRENGAEVFVRVTDSSKFTTRLVSGEPMTFRARLTTDGWALDQRAPRATGRW